MPSRCTNSASRISRRPDIFADKALGCARRHSLKEPLITVDGSSNGKSLKTFLVCELTARNAAPFFSLKKGAIPLP